MSIKMNKEFFNKMRLGEIRDFVAEFFKKMPWFLAKHAFGVIIILVTIDLIIGGLVYYKFIYSVQSDNLGSGAPLFQYESYRKIKSEWSEREAAAERSYLNLENLNF